MSHLDYYNENNPEAAAILRELIACGFIAPGVVDERSIEDVTPADLRGYTRHHFFAGIGGWAYALDLAGWPRDRPVWTGSCPCQPFSAAGKGAGFEDERHLWPAWQHLIAQCGPAEILGEQVASKDAEPWIDLVHADLEGMGYAFGCVPFPAAGVGAPHIRDRNYWAAYADSCASGERGTHFRGWASGGDAQAWAGLSGGRVLSGLADAHGGHASAERQQRGGEQRQQPEDGGVCWLGNADSLNSGRNCGDGAGSEAESNRGRPQHGAVRHGTHMAGGTSDAGPVNGHWRAADWLGCRDGKWRPVEPGTFPLAHGLPARVGRLRGYGNAIVPQAAAEFVRAYAGARGLKFETVERVAA